MSVCIHARSLALLSFGSLIHVPSIFILSGLGKVGNRSILFCSISMIIVVSLAFSSCSSLFSRGLSSFLLSIVCIGFRPLSILFVLYVIISLIYILSTSNGASINIVLYSLVACL